MAHVPTVSRRKRGVCVSISSTSTGDLVLGPGSLLHSAPKAVLQISVVTVKVISESESRRARKAVSVFGANVW